MPIITPIAAPNKGAEGSPSSAQADARARAIARLSGSSPSSSNDLPVANANSISAEEIGALSTSKGDSEAGEGQKDSIEATSEKPQEEAKKDEPLSPQFAMLARKEKALRVKAQAQEQAFKTQEASLLAREQAIKAKEAEYSEGYVSKEALKADIWGVLEELGVNYDQITEQAMSRQQIDPTVKATIDKLEAKIKALTDSQETSKKSQETAQTEAYKQAVEQIRDEAKALVASGDDYETVRETGSVDDVVELIEATFKEEGRLMTVDEAAKLVEEHLVDEALKIARLKKIQQKLQPAPVKTEAAAPGKQAAPAQQPQAKTLTNAMSGQRKLTARERAIAAFAGQNKG